MIEQFEIPLTTWLKPSTFRTFERIARERDTSIAVLIARLADQAVKPPERGSRRMTAERLEVLRDLHAEGWSDNRIARKLGFTSPAIAYHRHKLGLTRNYAPFGGTP